MAAVSSIEGLYDHLTGIVHAERLAEPSVAEGTEVGHDPCGVQECMCLACRGDRRTHDRSAVVHREGVRVAAAERPEIDHHVGTVKKGMLCSSRDLGISKDLAGIVQTARGAERTAGKRAEVHKRTTAVQKRAVLSSCIFCAADNLTRGIDPSCGAVGSTKCAEIGHHAAGVEKCVGKAAH